MREKRTHYGSGKRRRPFDYYEKRRGHRGEVDVIGWTTHLDGVLKGQPCKVFLDSFPNEAEAEAVYGSMNWNSPWLEPSVSLAHLPGEDDPVPGGMYPDDWDDGY